MRHSLRSVVCSSLLALGAAGGAAGVLAQSPPAAPAAASITSPRRQFGHDIGDDYVLVNYTQYVEYLKSSIANPTA